MAAVIQGIITGTYTPTYTGFGTDPTSSGAWALSGKQCTVDVVPSVFGTSNATSFTVTLPFLAGAGQFFPVRVRDNSTTQTVMGLLTLAVNSNVATVALTQTGGATTWTASGTKGVYFTITYIIA